MLVIAAKYRFSVARCESCARRSESARAREREEEVRAPVSLELFRAVCLATAV